MKGGMKAGGRESGIISDPRVSLIFLWNDDSRGGFARVGIVL